MAQQTARKPRGNLPAELTSFVGRRRELAAIRSTLSDARLLTLTGAGPMCGEPTLPPRRTSSVLLPWVRLMPSSRNPSSTRTSSSIWRSPSFSRSGRGRIDRASASSRLSATDGQRCRISSAVLRDRTAGTTEEMPAAAIFALIGSAPRTAWLPETVMRDADGFVLTGTALASEMKTSSDSPFGTSLAGVFAVGDVRADSIKRVASAVGEGSAAIRFVHEYLAACDLWCRRECAPGLPRNPQAR